MSCRRFREPKTLDEESLFAEESEPTSIWGVAEQSAWQNTCVDVATDEHDSLQIEDLTVRLAEMSVPSVAHWLSKFACEARQK
jgi:hypothetical protein